MAAAHPPSTRNPGAFGLLAMPAAGAGFPVSDQAVRPARTPYGGPSRIAVRALAVRLRQLAAEHRAAR